MTPPPAVPAGFAARLIDWQRRCGRHDLPWQGTRDPYRVWLSEIMLQQTQVGTVLDYYPRFLARFPDVHVLAAAPGDEVMALWSGLGYYSRARNLHRCAQVVVSEHGGRFPAQARLLQTLPGIGASTAAAIAAFCFGERISILDGNVRRVLARVLAFEEDLARAGPQQRLWALAQALLPEQPAAPDMVAYTQGLMDLGATVCTRSRPRCPQCPLHGLCQARERGAVGDFPVRSRTLKRQSLSWWLLLWRRPAMTGWQLALQRRPATGIWAGLYCPPVFASEDELRAAVAASRRDTLQALPAMSHSLTHREMRLHPLLLDADGEAPDHALPQGLRWVAAQELGSVGLPAPVRQLLQRL
ncbi:MAG: A/G-specific adenine glycosylase [Burkholderiales bacterium]|nr:MAG: A/G-specific adenine glycosylase [Burkholderiales bacterium]